MLFVAADIGNCHRISLFSDIRSWKSLQKRKSRAVWLLDVKAREWCKVTEALRLDSPQRQTIFIRFVIRRRTGRRRSRWGYNLWNCGKVFRWLPERLLLNLRVVLVAEHITPALIPRPGCWDFGGCLVHSCHGRSKGLFGSNLQESI